MPYVVELDLAPAMDAVGDHAVARHWLLDAVYGRDLLKAKLRKVRPDMTVPRMRHATELDHMLDYMVDVMGLRNWPEPVSFLERARYLRVVLRMMFAVENEQALPD